MSRLVLTLFVSCYVLFAQCVVFLLLLLKFFFSSVCKRLSRGIFLLFVHTFFLHRHCGCLLNSFVTVVQCCFVFFISPPSPQSSLLYLLNAVYIYIWFATVIGVVDAGWV